MKKVFLRLLLGIFALAVVALASSTARADIVVVTGYNNTGTTLVVPNAGTNVLTATGHAASGQFNVNFTSSSGSGLLSTNPGAGSIIGGTGNSPFTQITFGKSTNAGFTKAAFSLNVGANGSVVIHVEGININGGFFQDTFTVSTANNPNSFTVTAINGQQITSISLTAAGGATFTSLSNVAMSPVGPTAAGVSMSGRVVNSRGVGVRGARVFVTDRNGVTRTALTGAFGYYTFDGITAGETLVVGVKTRGYTFPQRVVHVGDDLTGVDFVMP